MKLNQILSKTVLLAKKYWWLLAILLVVVIIGARNIAASNSKPKLTFVQPIRKDITKTLEVSGLVDAKEKARLRFIAGGKVTRIGAKEGDWVKKWQSIATIDQADLNKRLQKDLNLYLQERYDWDQQLDNIEDRAIDTRERRQVDKAQLDLTNTVLDVEIRDIAIQNTTITAPFAGILVDAPTATAGVQLLSTDVFEIVNPRSLVFRAYVDEADIALVLAGQTGTITLDAFADKQLTASVSSIAYTSTETSGGTSFAIELPLAAETLDVYRIGMNGDVSLALETKTNTLSIPLAAIKERDGKTFVDVRVGDEKSQEVAEREIQTGLEANEEIEVTSGLSESDFVVLPE